MGVTLCSSRVSLLCIRYRLIFACTNLIATLLPACNSIIADFAVSISLHFHSRLVYNQMWSANSAPQIILSTLAVDPASVECGNYIDNCLPSHLPGVWLIEMQSPYWVVFLNIISASYIIFYCHLAIELVFEVAWMMIASLDSLLTSVWRQEIIARHPSMSEFYTVDHRSTVSAVAHFYQ